MRLKLMLRLGYLITLKKDKLSLLLAKMIFLPQGKPIKHGHYEAHEEKGKSINNEGKKGFK
jgi:hypothetical protein